LLWERIIARNASVNTPSTRMLKDSPPLASAPWNWFTVSKPGGMRGDLELLTALRVQHVEGLVEARPEPDELVAQIRAVVIAVRGDGASAVIVHDDHAPVLLKGRVAMKAISSANSSASSLRLQSSARSRL
jgi:hypothetical protein